MNTRFFSVWGSDRKYDRNIILAVLLISLMMSLLQVSSVNNLLPSIHLALDTSDSSTQWILSGFTLAIGVMLVPAGRMGDLAGRSGMFVLGLGLFATASLGCGMATTPIVLNIMRVIQGFGAGMYSPQVTGMILQYFQGKARAKAFGLMGLVVSMSVAVGPVLSGSMVNLFSPDPGWRVTFFLNVPIALIAMLASWRYLPFTHQKTRQHLDIDPVGMLLLVLAVLCIMVPFMNDASWRWFLLIAGAVLVTAWVIWEQKYELRGKEPMVSINLFPPGHSDTAPPSLACSSSVRPHFSLFSRCSSSRDWAFLPSGWGSWARPTQSHPASWQSGPDGTRLTMESRFRSLPFQPCSPPRCS